MSSSNGKKTKTKATKVEAIETKDATGFILVDPKSVNIGKQSRYFDHTEQDVDNMVTSYIEFGQLEPVKCRVVGDGYETLFGQCRVRAAVKYNELHPNKPMSLKVEVAEASDEDGFVQGIEENRARNLTTVVDDAFNQKTLREEFGYKDADIATRYGCHLSVVSRLKKITTLRRDVLKLIHDRVISFETACDLADLPEVDQDEILARAVPYLEEAEQKKNEVIGDWIGDVVKMNEDKEKNKAETETEDEKPEAKPAGKKPKTSESKTASRKAGEEIKAGVRQKLQERADKGEAKGGKGPKLKPLTLKQFRDLIETKFCGENATAKMKVFGGHVMDVINGKSPNKFIAKAKELLAD